MEVIGRRAGAAEAGREAGKAGTHLGDELEEGAERRVVDELRLELGAVVGGERAEPAVGGDVLLGHHVGERGAELGRRLEELARRLLVPVVAGSGV